MIPTPPAAFSPFTTTKSGSCASRMPGSREASVRRPIPPTTSPTKRSFTAGDSANLRAVETATVTLAARDLVKRYGDRAALRGVSLSAGRGELVAVIGPNGAGKTTLLSILAGIQRPDEGELTVAPAGHRLGAAAGGALRQAHRGGEPALFARLERSPDPRATVDRMLELTDLRDRADDQVGTLSGGNQQRVNIAIGLLAEPEVLLLDEPSAALDPRQRARLWEFILRLAGEGTTVIYATHNIQEADRYASQLIVLADGERLFDGAPRELEREVGTTGLDFEEAFVEFLHERGH